MRSRGAWLAEEHRHQPGILAELEALDLEVVLGDADAGPAARVADARVLGDLVEHPLVEDGVLAGHAALELVAAADRHVHERVEVHQAELGDRALIATVPSGVTAHSSQPLAGGPAAQLERRALEERRACLRRVAPDRAVAGVWSRAKSSSSVGVSGPCTTSAGIALDLHRPAAVVVDAVAVEGERGEAEEQDRIGRDRPPPRHVGGRRLAPRRLVALAGLHLFAKHRAPLVLDGEAVGRRRSG